MIRLLIRRLARREIARSVEAATDLLVSRIDDLETQIAALERGQRELLRIASVRTAERDRARHEVVTLLCEAGVSRWSHPRSAAALADEPGEVSA